MKLTGDNAGLEVKLLLGDTVEPVARVGTAGNVVEIGALSALASLEFMGFAVSLGSLHDIELASLRNCKKIWLEHDEYIILPEIISRVG